MSSMQMMEIAVTGEQTAAARIQVIGKRSLNMTPVMAAIRDLIIAGHKSQFETAGETLGTPWPPLAASTLERKERQGLPRDPLVATGALKTALEGGTGRKSSATPTTARVGVSSRLWYAIFAARGATASGSHAHHEPPRPITGMSAGQTETSLSMIQRYLVEGAKI